MKWLSASILLLLGSLSFAATAPDTSRIYFSPYPLQPQRVLVKREYYQWRLGNQFFDEGPQLEGETYPLLIGTLEQIQAINRTRSTSVKTYGPVRGYDAFFPKSPYQPLDAKGVINITNDYHDEEDVALLLTQFETNFPALAKKIQIGSTIWNRPIWALKISDNVAVDESETRAVFDANIHANEEAGPEVALDIIWQLLYGYTNNSTFASWVDNMEIYVIPCLNPDGRYYCDSVTNTWRKNLHDNDNNGVINTNDGVDLNRNSAFDWGLDNDGSSTNLYDVDYRGQHPASEPEIQAYDALLQRVQPACTLSIHSSYGLFYGPYGDYGIAPPKPDPFPSLGTNVARVCTDEYNTAYTFVSGSNFPYTVNGDRVDANYGQYGILAFGVEVGSGSQRPPYSTTRTKLVPGLRLGWQRFLAAAYTNGPLVRGFACDTGTGQPAPVRLHSLNLTNRPNDEHWTSYADGFFACPLPTAGTYRIVVAPLGQESLVTTQTIAVGVTAVQTNLMFNVAPVLDMPATAETLAWSNQNEHGLALLESAATPTDPWLPYQAVSTSGRTGQVDMTGIATSRFLRVRTAYRLFPANSNLVWIPAGNFQMGDDAAADTNEQPAAAIQVAGFAIDAKEVTYSNWVAVRAWATNNGYAFSTGQRGSSGATSASNHPVVKVTWHDAAKYCNARSQYEGLLPAYYTTAGQTNIYKSNAVDLVDGCVNWNANGYRLPTEAEWEKAARGGLTGRDYPWGNGIAASNALYASAGTSNVAAFAANGHGVYDAAGNAAEWCWDWYGSYSNRAAADPVGPTSGTYRVVRGGAWSNDAAAVRCAARTNLLPATSNTVVGLRCVRR